MKVSFDYLPEFSRRAKELRKKYPSFVRDYELFLDNLEKDPFSGEPLGHHTYKNRMSIASKGKGKFLMPTFAVWFKQSNVCSRQIESHFIHVSMIERSLKKGVCSEERLLREDR